MEKNNISAHKDLTSKYIYGNYMQIFEKSRSLLKIEAPKV
jgi:hypothetical protein